jgi:ABC-type spermidine/putrescine transport system permease subunit I
VLWQEFFNNRDWPVASALAVVMLAILIVPIILFNRSQAKEMEGKNEALQFLKLMLVAGLLFIYLPMLILVIYSFNASKLVTVWGGWSIKWYVGLLDNTQLMGSVARSLEIACYTALRPWRWVPWRRSC